MYCLHVCLPQLYILSFFCLNLPQHQLAYRLLLIITLSLAIFMKYCIWCSVKNYWHPKSFDHNQHKFQFHVQCRVSYCIARAFCTQNRHTSYLFLRERALEGEGRREKLTESQTAYEEKLRFNPKWQTNLRKQRHDIACIDPTACSHWKGQVNHSLPSKHSHSPSMQWPWYLPSYKVTCFHSLIWQKLT